MWPSRKGQPSQFGTGELAQFRTNKSAHIGRLEHGKPINLEPMHTSQVCTTMHPKKQNQNRVRGRAQHK